MPLDFSTILDLVGTGVKVYGALQAGQDAGDMYDAQAASSYTEARRALVDAAAYRDTSQIQAFKIRRQGGDVVSQARAAYGASNVNVNTGTAADVQVEIGKRANEDALNAILLGERQAQRLEDQAEASVIEAAAFGKAGRNAQKGANRTAIANAISGGASAWSKWSTNP
jgi:hypothetical protein